MPDHLTAARPSRTDDLRPRRRAMKPAIGNPIGSNVTTGTTDGMVVTVAMRRTTCPQHPASRRPG